jgi:urea transport system ATP-binding protein
MQDQTATSHALEFEGILASYGKKEVLRGVDLAVETGGEIVALFGGNGAGKSTILKVAAGLLKPRGGVVRFFAEDVTGMAAARRQARGLGCLLQGGQVFVNLTVQENLKLTLQYAREKDGLAEVLGRGLVFPALEPLLGRRAGLLSGGERQMLAIEMVLGQSPRMILLDEPTGALAPNLARSILEGVREFCTRQECSALLVEQNVEEAKRVTDRVYYLEDGAVVTRQETEE